MNNLFILHETYTDGYKADILDIISISAIFCGILVIVSKNPIVAVLFLIGLFASISCYLIILGLSFIGLAYLIVYIGAVSILFLFILMLINIRISELQSNTSNSIVLGTLIGILYIFPLSELLPYGISIFNNFSEILNKLWSNLSLHILNFIISSMENLNIQNILFYVSGKTWEGYLTEIIDIGSIGNIMYTHYNIWLIIASYILLLAMSGAIVITIKQKS